VTPKPISQRFDDSYKPVGLTIKEVKQWMTATNGSRLRLPPIQRSVVWTNEQIINYWDSLLRGYPPGLMMVHSTPENEENEVQKGYDADAKMVEVHPGDFHLFDGQQRMTAILLGFGMGQLKGARKLWVDFTNEPPKNNELKYQLRINSIGQPFGYNADWPNQKIELSERQKSWKNWNYVTDLKVVFQMVRGHDLIGSTCAVPIQEILSPPKNDGGWDKDTAISNLISKYGDANEKCIKKFVDDLDKALCSKIIFQEISSEIVTEPNEYIRFFTRLGQGGTRLSDDELTYSIIKSNYPEIRERMKEIMEGESGHIAGEVNLVLAALRVAKVLKPWEGAKEWGITGRPTPTFVSELQKHRDVELEFKEMIPPDQGEGKLKVALTNIRRALEYDKNAHLKGLPAMLLGQLPKELVDVLVLFAFKRGALNPWGEYKETLCTFVLYWLFFVNNDSKAADLVFRHIYNASRANAGEEKAVCHFTEESIAYLLKKFEKEGIAYSLPLPTSTEMPKLKEEVKESTSMLRPWADRFKALDNESDRKPGDSIRVLSTTRKLINRALMWLQRNYIAVEFSNYDPTSDRDEDLPVDLDHLIPNALFSFNWRYVKDHLNAAINEKSDIADNFWNYRAIVGNSLGNFRWLSSSKNRGRQDNKIDPLPNDFITDVDLWNTLILAQKGDNKWSIEHIDTFQQIIDLRTLELVEQLLTETGIEKILKIGHSTDHGN
jgi:hypothetical protein